MKLAAKFRSKNQFKQVLISAGALLSLASLFAQPLAVQALPINTGSNYQISQNTQPSKKIPYNRLVIARISLSTPEAQVRKILGKPLKTKNGYEAVAGKTRTLEYSGLTVKLLENANSTGKFSVYEITANSSKYATIDGIKVGDSILKVKKIYGQPQSSDTNSLSYEVNNSSPAYFNFAIRNGKVTKIIFGDFLG